MRDSASDAHVRLGRVRPWIDQVKPEAEPVRKKKVRG